MVLDDLLLHSGHRLVLVLVFGNDDGRRLDRLGGLGVRLEALVLLDVGDGELAVREFQVAARLQQLMLTACIASRGVYQQQQFGPIRGKIFCQPANRIQPIKPAGQ